MPLPLPAEGETGWADKLNAAITAKAEQADHDTLAATVATHTTDIAAKANASDVATSLGGKLDDSEGAVSALLPGNTAMYRYDAVAGWGNIPAALAADANISWIFLLGTDADAPTDTLVAGDWVWFKVPE